MIAVIGIPPTEHEGTQTMRMLRKNPVAPSKIIRLNLRGMPALRLMKPLLHIAYLRKSLGHQRRIRHFLRQLPG